MQTIRPVGAECPEEHVIRRAAPRVRATATHPATSFYRVETRISTGSSWLIATETSQLPEAIPAQVLVRIPASIKSLILETSGGAVEIGKVSCRVAILSNGGSIELTEADGPVVSDTAGLDINVGTVEGDGWFHTGGGKASMKRVDGNVDAWTGAGSILIGTGLRNALVRAGAGDVQITNCSGVLKVVSGGGNLLLGDITGAADIRTNGGNVRLHSARGFVHAETIGGRVDLQAVSGVDDEPVAARLLLHLSLRASRSEAHPYGPMLGTYPCTFHPVLRLRCKPASTWQTDGV